MEEQLQDDWLDARLREEAPYIDDGGFTAHVVQQLPVRRRQSRALRAVVLLAAALIASVVAYVLSGGGEFLVNFAAYLVAMPLSVVCAIAGICALVVMVVGASAAFSRSREMRS